MTPLVAGDPMDGNGRRTQDRGAGDPMDGNGRSTQNKGAADWPQYADNGTGIPRVPRMACVPEHVFQKSVLDGYSQSWAKREPVSHAQLTFDLTFDRNNWLPAQSMASWWGADSAPGLDYPSPGRAQLAWMLDDLLLDLQDLAGDTAETRTWRLVVTGVVTGPDSYVDRAGNSSSAGDGNGPCSQAPVLPMRISIRADLSPVHVQGDANGGESAHSLTQRSRSAGAVAQRLAATMREERPGSEAGVWLLAVDPVSVHVSMQLPCLRAMGASKANECEVPYAEFVGWGSVVPQVLLVALSGLSCIASLCGCLSAR